MLADPKKREAYSDAAIAPLGEDDDETLSLYLETQGGEAALARQRRQEEIRARTPSGRPHPALPSAVADVAAAD